MSFLEYARQYLLVIQQLLVDLLCNLLRLLGHYSILVQRSVKDAIESLARFRLLAHGAFLLGKSSIACHRTTLFYQVLALSIQTLKASLLELLQLVRLLHLQDALAPVRISGLIKIEFAKLLVSVVS